MYHSLYLIAGGVSVLYSCLSFTDRAGARDGGTLSGVSHFGPAAGAMLLLVPQVHGGRAG